MVPPMAQTRPVYGLDGAVGDEPNPAWVTYQAAQTAVAAASDLTKAEALLRRGRPAEPAPTTPASADWTAYQAAVATIDAAG